MNNLIRTTATLLLFIYLAFVISCGPSKRHGAITAQSTETAPSVDFISEAKEAAVRRWLAIFGSLEAKDATLAEFDAFMEGKYRDRAEDSPGGRGERWLVYMLDDVHQISVLATLDGRILYYSIEPKRTWVRFPNGSVEVGPLPSEAYGAPGYASP